MRAGLLLTACAVAAVSIPATADEQAYSAAECRYAAVDGKAWRALGSGYKYGDRLFQALPKCRAGTYPVSGGVRYEGVWNDISMASKWTVVQSQVWDPTFNPLVGWSCMVLRTDAAPKQETPAHIWCSVLCCP